MFRKLIGVSAALLMSTTALAVASEGIGGAAPLPNAVGTVSCNITGTGRFSPKLTLAGVATTAVKFKFNAASPTSGGCTGSATISNSAGTVTSVTIFGVKVKAVGYLTGPANANSCTVFNSVETIGAVVVRYTWAATPAIAPTFRTFTGGSAPIASGGLLDTLSLPVAGTVSTGSGSFPLPGPSPISLLTNIVRACPSGWGPYPSFAIGAGSTIALP